ncbi:hypothetical protein D9611_001056 [Ephemerocybe angulata]|uniref:Casein kinase substrate phosphoprotein PP28 domain-containing protein n=1 Tax=Ephemerocybe angulata TaxID=980116 RepID=A0A8H5BP88_9AGAR|nr:hypothetical protein D9611_001056 [Tulosesus angulatus]
MVRGSGKFKQKRGGGRSFSKHIDENGEGSMPGNRRGARKPPTDALDEDSSEEDSDEEDEDESGSGEEEESEEEADDPNKPELTRAERKALKKKQADEKKAAAAAAEGNSEDDDLINPNHVTKALKISDLGSSRELSRREREEKEKKDAKERYWKLHLQGKTQEAKTDLARLAKIRADREEAQAKRKAEAEAKAAEIEARKQAQLSKRRV